MSTRRDSFFEALFEAVSDTSDSARMNLLLAMRDLKEVRPRQAPFMREVFEAIEEAHAYTNCCLSDEEREAMVEEAMDKKERRSMQRSISQ
jgi:hypothetical protein